LVWTLVSIGLVPERQTKYFTPADAAPAKRFFQLEKRRPEPKMIGPGTTPNAEAAVLRLAVCYCREVF
jgi:hypothetical protein